MTHKTIDESILHEYEAGQWTSVSPSDAEKRKFKQSARATFLKDRRVNVRLSSADLMDIQARAAEEGMPYQTLIASVLHKFVSGRLLEKASHLTKRSNQRDKKQRTA